MRGIELLQYETIKKSERKIQIAKRKEMKNGRKRQPSLEFFAPVQYASSFSAPNWA